MSPDVPQHPEVPPRPDVPALPDRGREGAGDRPRATWRWWEAALVYLLGLLAGGVAAVLVAAPVRSPTAAILLATLVVGVVQGAIVVLWLRVNHPGWERVVGFPGRPLKELAAGAAAGLALYAVMVFGVGVLLAVVLGSVSDGPVQAPEQLPRVTGAGDFLLAALAALVAAPVVEELFFRGCLFRAVRDRRGFAPAAGLSAALFGAAHYSPGPWQDSVFLIAVMVFTGVGLAFIYERRGNIVASIAAHGAFNMLGLAFILLS